MDAREEAQDLAVNPLPLVIPAGVDTKALLTHALCLEEEIKDLQKQIEEKSEEKAAVLKHIVDNNIIEDSLCKLVTEKHTSLPNRVINIDKIQKNYPEVYKRIWKQKRDEIEADLDKFGLTVDKNKVNLKPNQKIVESAMKAEGHKLEEVLEPGGPATVTYTYSVVRK